jgi:hypothetical protein
MAIKSTDIKDGTIEVISRVDSSVKCDSEKYDEYLKNLDESLLEMDESDKPTRFVLRKVLPYGLAKKVQNAQVRYEKGEAQFQMSFIMEDVRCSLVDVKNPEDLPDEEKIKFEKDPEGGASEALITKLLSAGIVTDLFHAKQNFLNRNQHKADSKKS